MIHERYPFGEGEDNLLKAYKDEVVNGKGEGETVHILPTPLEQRQRLDWVCEMEGEGYTFNAPELALRLIRIPPFSPII